MYKRYEKYKDSGVKWIGEIPVHWELRKHKNFYSFNMGETILKEDLVDDGTVPVYSATEKGGIFGFINKPKVKLRKGDLVIPARGVSIGYVNMISDDIATTTQTTIYGKKTSSYILSDFVYFFMIGNKSTLFFYDRTAIPQVTVDQVKNNHLLFPTLNEQMVISKYLYRKTFEIDSLIADKEELIKKLEEYKQSLITEAVTKGLNPDAKMKASGIEWIGEIPEHWEVKKLQYSGFCQNGVSKGADYFGKGYPFVSYGDVYNNVELPLLVEGLADANLSDRNLYSVCEGDIFFTRTSETIEEIGITSTCIKAIKDATFSGFLIRFRPIKGFFYKHFSKYYFRSYMHRRFFVKEMNLVTRASLSQGLLKRLPIISPPYKEQVLIADYLDELITEIDSSIYSINIQIDLVKSYRQSLIYEAVTGKIDVRNYQLERSEQFA